MRRVPLVLILAAAEEKNSENLLVLRAPELAKIYSANWAEHKKHAEAY